MYHYDWANRQTDDPQGLKVSPPGSPGCHKVLLNGEDVAAKRVYFCQTGPSGWIEYYETLSDGLLAQDSDGNLVCRKEYGNVVYIRES